MSSTRRTSRNEADEHYCLVLKLLNSCLAVGLEDRHCGNLVGTVALLLEGIRDERSCTAEILRKSGNVEANLFSCPMAPSLLFVVHATRGGWAPHVIKNLNQGGSG